MARWTDLPCEMRHAIFSVLAADTRRNTVLLEPNRDLSTYATVCRDWQEFFERENYQQLILTPACLADFGANVSGQRRDFVRHLWFRIQLPRYYCGPCKRTESSQNEKRNNAIVEKALNPLFEILARWDFEPGKPDASGLTLELSVHSPSDSRHHFQNRTFQAFRWRDGDCFENDVSLGSKYLARQPVLEDDEYHGWVDGQYEYGGSPLSHFLNLESHMKFLGPPLCVQGELPVVLAVTGFLIRRQYHRFFADETLCRIFESLPCLSNINYETCFEIVISRSEYFGLAQSYVASFSTFLPSMLKRLSLFWDFDDDLHDVKAIYAKSPDPFFGLALAVASRNLEELSVAFLIDAEHFLQPFFESDNDLRQSLQWDQLTTLALSSRLLHCKNQKAIDTMFSAAALAAHRMPKLQVLEIWNGQKGGAAVFRYERDEVGTEGERRGHAPVLSWQTSWDSHLDPQVKEAWNRVAVAHTGQDLIVQTGYIPAPKHSYGSVLKFLKLRKKILHPISLHQVQWEADNDN